MPSLAIIAFLQKKKEENLLLYLEHDHLTKTIRTRSVWDQHVKKRPYLF